LSTKKNIPGPGSYNPKDSLDKFGVYMLSNMRNSRAAHFSPSTRFGQNQLNPKDQPGPGSYENRDYTDGNYYLSQYKSSLVRKFGTSARI